MVLLLLFFKCRVFFLSSSKSFKFLESRNHILNFIVFSVLNSVKGNSHCKFSLIQFQAPLTHIT